MLCHLPLKALRAQGLSVVRVCMPTTCLYMLSNVSVYVCCANASISFQRLVCACSPTYGSICACQRQIDGCESELYGGHNLPFITYANNAFVCSWTNRIAHPLAASGHRQQKTGTFILCPKLTRPNLPALSLIGSPNRHQLWHSTVSEITHPWFAHAVYHND